MRNGNGTNKIMGVLRDNHEFLSWLHEEEGISIKEMPEKYKEDCKLLQKLGIVYRRNNLSLGIRWQRLRRLISKTGGDVPYQPDELVDYFAEPSLTA